MFKYRVRVPGFEWTNWNDWTTTPLSEMLTKAVTGPTPHGVRQPPIHAAEIVREAYESGFDYEQPIGPPPRQVTV